MLHNLVSLHLLASVERRRALVALEKLEIFKLSVYLVRRRARLAPGCRPEVLPHAPKVPLDVRNVGLEKAK